MYPNLYIIPLPLSLQKCGGQTVCIIGMLAFVATTVSISISGDTKFFMKIESDALTLNFDS